MIKPFFSIIIPVYNIAQEYLKCCIDSLLNQTMSDIEIILVDDGSVAECAELCDKFASCDERVKVIHQENQGVSVARNNGILAATADWIMFVDADDWVELYACERLKDELENKAYDMLMFRGIRESKSTYVMEYGLEFTKVYNLCEVKDKEFLYRRVMQVPNSQNKTLTLLYYSWDKVYRREFLLENNLKYPVGLAKSEDKVFIALCLTKAKTFYHIDEALYHYRINAESVCQRYSNNMDTQRIKLTKELAPVAEYMNSEISLLLNQPNYNKLINDYERFVFGILTDVLYLQFYHKDNPNKKGRRKEAIKFLRSEPIKTIINKIPYSILSNNAKMKKLFLKYGLVSSYCYLSKKMRK